MPPLSATPAPVDAAAGVGSAADAVVAVEGVLPKGPVVAAAATFVAAVVVVVEEVDGIEEDPAGRAPHVMPPKVPGVLPPAEEEEGGAADVDDGAPLPHPAPLNPNGFAPALRVVEDPKTLPPAPPPAIAPNPVAAGAGAGAGALVVDPAAVAETDGADDGAGDASVVAAIPVPKVVPRLGLPAEAAVPPKLDVAGVVVTLPAAETGVTAGASSVGL